MDFVLGFADRRYDPLANKGLWTGLLFVLDDQAQAKIKKLNAAARELLAALPVAPNAEPPAYQVKAVQLLTAIGANGPLCPDVYRDPPYFDQSDSCRQSLIFTNVIAARARARTPAIALEFCADAQDSAQARLYAEDLAFARAALNEVLNLRDSRGLSDFCSGSSQVSRNRHSRPARTRVTLAFARSPLDRIGNPARRGCSG